jgi:hypothetical protein
MMPPTKKVLLWTRSLWAMTSAGVMSLVLALRALPGGKFYSTSTEWMGIPSPRGDETTRSVEGNWVEGGSR